MKVITNSEGRSFAMGRRAPLARGPMLKLGHFLSADLLPAPPVVGDEIKSGTAPIWSAEENVLGNDQYGDCTCAGMLHIMNQLRANNQAANAWRVATREDALALYSRVTSPPFVPGPVPLNDNGADLPTVLNVVQQHGAYSDGTGKISGYVAIDASKPEEIKQALYLFGNLYMGLGLPDAYVNPFPSGNGFVWDVNGSSNPNQGHCIVSFGYNENEARIDTWGLLGGMTFAALAAYLTANAGGEMYAILAPDWISQATQKAPNGFNAAQLEQYLKDLN